MIANEIPGLLLGTAMWGWAIPRQRCFELLDSFYENGFREVDTATNYPINKKPEDFRKAENILLEWIRAHRPPGLQVMMKVGSVDNMRTPDHNLSKSFLLMLLDEYLHLFDNKLHTLMVHWDNRASEAAIMESLEALDIARKAGLRIGLSGIRHPEIYARLNEQFGFDFRIQMKHNILHSDYGRYREFHGSRRFITYGINVDTADYHAGSSLRARGGDTEREHPLAAPLRQALQQANEGGSRPAVHNFNHCGMAFAYYSPDIEGILLGPSKVSQLEDSVVFYEHLKTYDYRDLYQSLKRIHAENA